MAADGGLPYVATHKTVGLGGEVWSYDGATWSQVNTDGFGDAKNAAIAANGLAEFGGFLNAGTFDPGGGEVWEIDPQQSQGPISAIPVLSGLGLLALVAIIGIAAVSILQRI